MLKQILYLAICCLMLCVSSIQAFASVSNIEVLSIGSFEISPLMDNIAQANCSLYIDSKGVATIKSSVYGYQGITTRVEISAYLQQYQNGRWVTLKTFISESDSHRTSLSNTYSVTKGYSYRVKATIKAYNDSFAETRIVTSSEANY